MNAQHLKKFPAWFYYFTGVAGLAKSLWTFVRHFNDVTAQPWLELGAGWMLAGLLCIWCGMDYNRSPMVRFFCMLFYGWVSFIYWLQFARGGVPVHVSIILTLPFLLLISAEFIICKLIKD